MKFITHLLSPIIVVVSAIALVAIFSTQPQTVRAASGKDFNPGHIIDDAVFYNEGSMSSSQIQKFLDSKNPNCDYNGTQPASDWGYPNITHAQLAEYKRNGTNGFSKDTGFHAPPYKCLTKYTQTTPQMEAASGYCGAVDAGSRTAAQIINDIAKACGINPQVLIVLLEKEQSLVTDSWPLNRQLRNATGFACPDTAPCNPAYEGFFYQVYYAARQFKVYQAFPNSYNYTAGRTNRIYWHPDLSRCGSSEVYIKNQATAALYIYTPYRPNTAALNNLYGTGDSCSSYGNRNFWRIFTDWFGSTRASFTPLKSPRWMQLRTATYKKSPVDGTNVDSSLAAGTQIFFTSKVEVDGKWYLRTKHDTSRGLWKGILLSDLQEVPISFLPLVKPRWLETNTTIQKEDPITGLPVGASIPAGTKIYFIEKMDIGNKTYLQTNHDVAANSRIGISLSNLSETTIEYTDLKVPRWMKAHTPTSSLDLKSYTNIGGLIEDGQELFFNRKVTINNTTFVSTGNPASDTYTGVPLADFHEIPAIYDSLKIPRWMTINTATHKRNPITGVFIGDSIPAGTKIYFPTKFAVGNQVYLRTQYGTDRNINEAIPLSDLSEDYVDLLNPRSMTLKQDTYKLSPTTGSTSGAIIPAGTTLYFSTKVDIYGKTYMRTLDDTNTSNNVAIPLSSLKESL